MMIRRKKLNGKKIILAVFFWIIFFTFLNLFSPENLLTFFGFYFLLCFALLATFKMFTSLLRGIIWIAIIIVCLLLRQHHLDNFINSILLLGILVTLEIYLRR